MLWYTKLKNIAVCFLITVLYLSLFRLMVMRVWNTSKKTSVQELAETVETFTSRRVALAVLKQRYIHYVHKKSTLSYYIIINDNSSIVWRESCNVNFVLSNLSIRVNQIQSQVHFYQNCRRKHIWILKHILY